MGLLKAVKQFHRNEAGNVMIMFVISIVAIVAMVGATLALSMDSKASNELQYTVDGAALSGATAFVNASSAKLDERIKEAERLTLEFAKQNASVQLADFDVLSKSEDAYGQQIELAVELEFSPANPAAKMTGRNANVDIRRGATAAATWGFPLCTLSLAGQGSGVTLSDEAILEAKNCLVWSNTPGRESMLFTGGSLESKYSCAHGKYRKEGFASIRPTPSQDCRKIPDPLDKWKAPLPGSIEVIKELAEPLPAAVQGDIDPALLELQDDFKNDPDPIMDQIRKLMKEPSDLECCFAQYAYELMRIGEEGVNPERDPLVEMTLPGLSITLDRDQLDDVTGPAEDNDWSHPSLNIDQGGQTDLRGDGTLRRGPGKGFSLFELAQGAGLIGPMSQSGDAEPPLSEDRFYDIPTLTVNPGTFEGLHIFEGHVRFTPGVYHIVNAPFVLRRRATMTATDVTFVLHGDLATFEVWDEARLEISAPKTGITAGFAIAQNKESIKLNEFGTSKLAGSGTASLIGTVYLPKQNFEISGSGSGEQASPLLQIVANEMRVLEQGALKIDFDEGKTEVPLVIKPERTARLIK